MRHYYNNGIGAPHLRNKVGKGRRRLSLPPFVAGTAVAFLGNLALAYLAYMACRVVFTLTNWSVYGSTFGSLSLWKLLKGSLLFDSSAILYTNSLYALLMLLPLHWKETRGWQTAAKWVFVIVNAMAVVANLSDAVYFKYIGRRTTSRVADEFANESNLGSVFLEAIMQYWWLVIIGVAIIYCLWRCYITPQRYSLGKSIKARLGYYAVHLLCLLVFVPFCVAGMRGGFTHATRPVTISNANQYVNRPLEAAIVLNTPFSLIRTTGKNVFADPGYFTTKELNAIYSPIRNLPGGKPNSVARRKNVVVLIVESFGREYMGAYNRNLDGGHYKGFTPFADELFQQSLTFDFTFANGRGSIDGMPSILSSIPRFCESFFLTPASLNDVSGLAGELGKAGYSSAFFHGAENGSMGFEAFARTTGYQKYYGRTEFKADKRFRGDEDYDGIWAIWDEPFLQFFALKMGELREPFLSTIFTASSHHPYNIPKEYYSQFDRKGEEHNPMHKCIRYTDMALRKFFETARKQPWYKNTIFVFTADHANVLDHPEYATELGLYCVPIMFYDPSGEMPRGQRPGIAQQADIMPTILQYLGYGNPYVAFGNDLFSTPAEDTWTVNNNNGVYQYVRGDHLIQFDGIRTTAMYNYKSDWMMTDNLLNRLSTTKQSGSDTTLRDSLSMMERDLKALIQSYMLRMTTNNLIYRK